MNKNLAAAVRTVSGRDKVTALGEKDLVVALGAASRGGGDETVGTLPYTGGTVTAGPIASAACPHVEYPAAA
jgi:hypothetical protein